MNATAKKRTTTPQEERLSREEVEVGLQRVIQEGMASQTMESLTKGVFLVGLALQLGASNRIVGLLGAIPFLSNLFQIIAIHLVEKYRDRRKIVVLSFFIGRAFLVLVAVAAFIPDKHIAMAMVVFAIVMRYCIGALAGCAWNSWMRDLVPKVILGKFFSKRRFYTTTIAATIGIGAGFFLDWWRAEFPGNPQHAYAVLYIMGFIAGMISAGMSITIPHPRMREPEANAYRKKLGFHYLKEPLQNENFRKLIWFLMAWSFAINLASPFFAVYMLKTLHYDMIFVVAIVLMSQMVNAFCLRIWGKYSDRYSNKTVLGICCSLFIFCVFGWTFTTFPEKHFLTTPLLIVLHILMGFALSGVSLSTANIAMKLTPSRQATSYLATNTIMTSLAAGIAPLFGGYFADFFEDKTLSLDFNWQDASGEISIHTLIIQHWDFFFLLASILGLYALRRLALVDEEGTVKEKVVIRELMLDTGRVLRTLSTVDGLRELTMAPMAMMVNRISRRGSSWRKEHRKQK